MVLNIDNLWVLNIAGVEVWITETIFNTWLIMLFLIVIAVIARIKLRNFKEVPTGFQNLIEAIVETFDNFAGNTLGEKLSYIAPWFFTHPHIPDSAKQQLFHNAFSEDLSKHLRGFLYLMVRKNRETLIVPTLTEYIDRINRRLGKMEAKVVSAKALTEKQIESIRSILSKKIDMQVEVKATVDPDVIGGFYVLVGGRVFDGTVRSELNILRERLKRGSYE